MIKFLTNIIIFIFPLIVSGQDTTQLKVMLLDKETLFLEQQEVKLDLKFTDTTQVIAELSLVLKQLWSKAYLEASVDSFSFEEAGLVKAFLHVGNAYQWAKLKNGNIEKEVLNAIGFRDKQFSESPFSYEQLIALQAKILEYAEDHGYPFASVYLDDIHITEKEVSASIFFQKNKLIILDRINIEGNAKISQNYMEQYLGLRPGTPYQERKIKNVRNRIKELPFLQEKRDVVVTFKEDKATINLFLEKKNASRFDFLIGLLPQSQNDPLEQRQSLIFTGNLKADLFNQFGLGERIVAGFQQLRPGTQDLQLRFNYPYVLNLPFGADLQFELYKRDSTYLDVISEVGIQYLLEGGNYIKAYWNNQSSSLLSIDEQGIRQTQRLPANLDIRNTFFGLEYLTQHLDYRLNPRQGWSAFANVGVGQKRIRRSNLILELQDSSDQFDYNSLYDSMQLKTVQYRISGILEGYVPLLKRTTMKIALNAGAIFSETPVFRNEQYRIGGIQTLRGFDEESVFASLYGILTLEYRFIIGPNSFLFAFGDLGYVEDVSSSNRSFDQPRGFGAGLNFETKVGIFGLSLGWGTQQGNPIDLAAPKVHFGYVSMF